MYINRQKQWLHGNILRWTASIITIEKIQMARPDITIRFIIIVCRMALAAHDGARLQQQEGNCILGGEN